jgi:hypothetical protein
MLEFAFALVAAGAAVVAFLLGAAGVAGFEFLTDEVCAKIVVPPRSNTASESDAIVFFIKLSFFN